MGILLSCCRDSSGERALITPDIETKRRQQAEAAERRIREQQNRGIKDPDKLREKTERLERIQKKQEEAERLGSHGNTLKWTIE